MTGRAVRFALGCLPILPLAAQQPTASGASSRIELIHELTIGADPADPNYEFAVLAHVAVTGSGAVFVMAFDGRQPQIRRFDATGRFRGAVGRNGAGPGEYGFTQGMEVIGDTLLVVFDAQNRRVVVFDTAGVFRRSFAVAGGAGLEHAFAALTDGSVAVRVMAPAAGSRSAPIPTALIRYRLSGELRDTLPAPALQARGLELRHPGVGRRTAFAAESVFTLRPDGGMATAHSTTYRIRVAPASFPAFTIERPDRPLPLEGGERDQWLALAARIPTDRAIDIPRRKPLIRDLLADGDSRLWVQVYTPGVHREPPPRPPGSPERPQLTMWEHNAFDVFDAAGRYLGRVDLKPFSRLLAVRGERLWVSEETQDGGYALVRYRLRLP